MVEALLTKADPEICGSGHSGGTTALMEATVHGHEQVIGSVFRFLALALALALARSCLIYSILL